MDYSKAHKIQKCPYCGKVCSQCSKGTKDGKDCGDCSGTGFVSNTKNTNCPSECQGKGYIFSSGRWNRPPLETSKSHFGRPDSKKQIVGPRPPTSYLNLHPSLLQPFPDISTFPKFKHPLSWCSGLLSILLITIYIQFHVYARTSSQKETRPPQPLEIDDFTVSNE